MNKINTDTQLQQTIFSGNRFVPMLLSTPMVEALLNNSKKEKRTAQGLEKINTNSDNWVFKQFSNFFYFTNKITQESICVKSKINIADIIWVRETFQITDFLHPSDENYGYIYKASENGKEWESNSENWKWKPPLFMPKEACRLFLKCVSVHVERLQEIDEQSAMNEGIMKQKTTIKDRNGNSVYVYGATHYSMNGAWSGCHKSAISAFRILWRETNGFESWDLNPFVWVYKFERVDAPDDFR
jgi:hypothetical protein